MEEARRRRQQFEENDTEQCAPGSAVGRLAGMLSAPGDLGEHDMHAVRSW